MSERLFEASNGRLFVASFAGPANTLERTRARVQFEVVDTKTGTSEYMSLGFNDVVALHAALNRWIAQHREAKAPV